MGKVKKYKKNETILGKKIPFLDDASDKYKHVLLWAFYIKIRVKSLVFPFFILWAVSLFPFLLRTNFIKEFTFGIFPLLLIFFPYNSPYPHFHP